MYGKIMAKIKQSLRPQLKVGKRENGSKNGKMRRAKRRKKQPKEEMGGGKRMEEKRERKRSEKPGMRVVGMNSILLVVVTLGMGETYRWKPQKGYPMICPQNCGK